MINLLEPIIKWIQEQVSWANAQGVIVGLSGGVDSALVAYLAKRAFPQNSLALLLPIGSSRPQDKIDALAVANYLKLDYQEIDLTLAYNLIAQPLVKQIEQQPLIGGNIQARLRMLHLYALAQSKNYLVLGTDNKAEYDLGYFTKYGDGACDLLPISHLFKSQVYALAKAVGIPESVLTKAPSAGFWSDQADEIELGFSYNDYEAYCHNQLVDLETKTKIERQINLTNHKRQPIPRFGIDKK